MVRKMKRFKLFVIIALLIGLSSVTGTAVAQSGYPQAADKHVNDFAGLISPIDEAALQTLLTDLERQTGIEATVLTVDSIHKYPTSDATIESFATNLFNDWGIGDADRNDGLLVLVALDERQVRLELGRGYGREFDAAMQRVIDEEMLPRFREERYSLGIYEGTRAAIQTLSGGTFQPPKRTFWQTAVAFGRTVLSYWWAIVLGVVGFFGVVQPLGRRTLANIRSRIPPRCLECRHWMSKLDPSAVPNHYSEAQRMEVKLGSVTYSGWKCFHCGRVDLSPRVVLPIKYTLCPDCNHRTVGKYVSVKPARPGRKGVKRDTFTCHNCDYFHEEKTKITYQRPASGRSSNPSSTPSSYDSGNSFSSSGSSGSSGSSDSFGGGSSSGGGAGGSW